MVRKWKRTIWITLTLVLLLVSLAMASAAPQAIYGLPWYTMDAGGGAISGGVYRMNATIGQAEDGKMVSGGNYRLYSGYWGAFKDGIALQR